MATKLTQQNIDKLNTVHPALRLRAWAIIGQLANEGFFVKVEYGFRDRTKQKELHEKFLRGKGGKAAKPGYSYHNYGLAVDMIPFEDKDHDQVLDSAELTWNVSKPCWKAFSRAADLTGVIHGRHFADHPHIEFHPSMSIKDLLRDGQPHGDFWGAWSRA